MDKPWDTVGCGVYDAGGNLVCATSGLTIGNEAEQIKRATRVKAAMNAVAGIPTEALEQDAVAKLALALEGLLSAAIEHDEANNRQMIDPHAEDDARAALAALKGEETSP